MDINIVKQLRDATGASVMECNNALEEANGDLTKATEILKIKGKATALKKSGRELKSGMITSYIHLAGKVGVLLDLRCETDFVAKNENFGELAHEICLQIAAMSPEFVSEQDIPEGYFDKEKASYIEDLKDSGKPENIINQIVEGRVQKKISEVCLLNQPFVKNPSETVGDMLKGYVAKIGENLKIERFARFEV